MYISDLLIEQLGIQFFIRTGPTTYQVLTVTEAENNIVIKVKETIDEIIHKSDITNVKEQKEVKALLTDHPKVIHTTPFSINELLTATFKVKVIPKQFSSRPLSNEMLAILLQNIDEMEKDGVIHKIKEAKWISPIVLVRKPDGSWRVTIDYRYLNKHIITDVYPLPHI